MNGEIDIRNQDNKDSSARQSSSKWETLFIILLIGFVVLDSLLFWLVAKR